MVSEALANYSPTDPSDANTVIERLVPFLKHANHAVVVGVFRTILHLVDYSSLAQGDIFGQILPPFITLVTSSPPEIQYVVLRALALFVTKFPHALTKEIRSFFCKYNDPNYIKIEKLDIITTICTPTNAGLVLDELSEYAQGVDIQFVRKSIAALGLVALKIPGSTARCVDILISLMKGHAEYALEEAICVMTDILRKFPGEFESAISHACSDLDKLKDARAKSAGVWILGEYADVIQGVDVLLDHFVDTFVEEPPVVQLHILSALAKVYVKKPEDTQDQLQVVLNEAMKETTFPDVRNRALIYWRILSAEDSHAADLILFTKSAETRAGSRWDPEVLQALLRMTGTIAGVLHALPAEFVTRVDFAQNEADHEASVEREKGVKTPAVEAKGRPYKELHLSDDTQLGMWADFDREHLYLRLVSKSTSVLSGFAVAVNQNAVGLSVVEQPFWPPALLPNGTADVVVPIEFKKAAVGNATKTSIEIALKTSGGLLFALGGLPLEHALQPEGKLEQPEWRQLVSSGGEAISVTLRGKALSVDELNEKRFFVLAKTENRLYFSFALVSGVACAGEIETRENDVVVRAKVTDQQYAAVLQRNLRACLIE